MAYCVKCGGRVEDTEKTCPFCGAEIPTMETYFEEPTRAGYFSEAEVKANKGMAVLCYLGILVFVPILAGNKQSEYLKLHKNQGLTLFILNVIVDIIEKSWGIESGFFAHLTGGVVSIGYDIASFVIAILWIMGIVYACKGTRNELPGIGKIKIFK